MSCPIRYTPLLLWLMVTGNLGNSSGGKTKSRQCLPFIDVFLDKASLLPFKLRCFVIFVSTILKDMWLMMKYYIVIPWVVDVLLMPRISLQESNCIWKSSHWCCTALFLLDPDLFLKHRQYKEHITQAWLFMLTPICRGGCCYDNKIWAPHTDKWDSCSAPMVSLQSYDPIHPLPMAIVLWKHQLNMKRFSEFASLLKNTTANSGR